MVRCARHTHGAVCTACGCCSRALAWPRPMQPRDTGGTSMVPLRAAGSFGLESEPCGRKLVFLIVCGSLAAVPNGIGVRQEPRSVERAERVEPPIGLRLGERAVELQQGRDLLGVGDDAAHGVPDVPLDCQHLLLLAPERSSLGRRDTHGPRGELPVQRPQPLGICLRPAVCDHRVDDDHAARLRRPGSGPRGGGSRGLGPGLHQHREPRLHLRRYDFCRVEPLRSDPYVCTSIPPMPRQLRW